MMARALELAAKGMFTAAPNPRVGCVVTQGEAVVGEGWHEKAGGPHAEVVAIGEAGAKTAGATAYVTLEPCNHRGRTPPCVDLILAKKIRRVVAATLDPNPQAAHGGDKLAAAGVRFEHGLMEAEAREMNIGFVSRMTRGRPWVRMKIAATLDGRTALGEGPYAGKSQWITGLEARQDGHRWRARACAVLTGYGTIKTDNPRLTVRDVETSRQPLRVVVDSRLQTPESARILEGGNVLVFSSVPGKLKGAEIVALPNPGGKVDLPKMLAELARRGVNELHVESGSRLNGSLVREGCVDEFLLYLNPSFLGDTALGMLELPGFSSLDERTKVKLTSLDRVGDDIRIIARA
ncbi:MAG TPA: bifunctional diaminohydroxyphosphoribosylaminopyrimidine deaminase/5-amino-6-(5-phosphoribosylamino)uracil reductase RibD [Burkholderiales bacterium]|nr:bifunctional diaminohydroxyphosphoribosylaminopyrimidine deaminase/5-amino-6-(5-phosphoribosylamino)uracil reductase RibD [Burkholderiales bacterium]